MDDFFSVMRDALFEAKFALEQDSGDDEKKRVIRKINSALDRLSELQQKFGPGDESNPFVVDTLSSSLADPFRAEPKTTKKISVDTSITTEEDLRLKK